MVVFKAVRSREHNEDGWAVERNEPDGLRIVVTRIFPDEQAAILEAQRLNREAEKRSIR